MTNPAALTLGDPLDLDDARKASRAVAEQAKMAIDDLKGWGESFAKAERDYRKALAVKAAELRGQGHPATLVRDLARGDEHVATLCCDRDNAATMMDVCKERLRMIDGQRAALRQLVEWSRRYDERAA